MDYDLTRKVLAALEREEVKYVVFGAVALALHGLPRATEDLDIFIAPEPDNIERLKLYRMKKGTVRPKDWGDAQQIARRFGLKE